MNCNISKWIEPFTRWSFKSKNRKIYNYLKAASPSLSRLGSWTTVSIVHDINKLNNQISTQKVKNYIFYLADEHKKESQRYFTNNCQRRIDLRSTLAVFYSKHLNIFYSANAHQEKQCTSRKTWYQNNTKHETLTRQRSSNSL